MRRTTCSELLDEDRGTRREIEDSLDDLWRINRWLGGVSASLRLLEDFFLRAGVHPARVLDVGAGDSRLAGQLQKELQRRGLEAEFTVLDRRLSHLQKGYTPAGAPQPVVADALALPFADGSFNVVMCNLFFHHFSDEPARQLLCGMAAIASEAVIINDPERHRLPYLFIRYAPWFARSPITRHDAPASVRQAYTRSELAAIATAAGFTDFDVKRFAPFRLGLTLWKNPRRN
jgi:2-polyprenyl-3-methyl-5-hydroxy-6-metoxy-1,4-benzoquinol methylase